MLVRYAVQLCCIYKFFDSVRVNCCMIRKYGAVSLAENLQYVISL